MINVIKHFEFFNPMEVKEEVHIIGCGAIGSTLAVQLAHLGIKTMILYDFDVVEDYNVANQMFREVDIGKEKTAALTEQLLAINKDLQIITEGKYEEQALSGYVFLCVDSIELRKKITESVLYNRKIKAIFDFRMGLSSGQHYAADWSSLESQEMLLSSMQFTDEEAREATPLSACGTTLSVIPTVWIIVSVGVSNFINFHKGEKLVQMISVDAFSYHVQKI